MVVNKSLAGPTPVALSLSHFAAGAAAQAWHLAARGAITRLPDAVLTSDNLAATLPAQSVTLYIIPAGKAAAGR